MVPTPPSPLPHRSLLVLGLGSRKLQRGLGLLSRFVGAFLNKHWDGEPSRGRGTDPDHPLRVHRAESGCVCTHRGMCTQYRHVHTVQACTHICMHRHTCMHMYTAHTHAQAHVHAHMYTAHTRMHRHTCMHMYTAHTCMHRHTCMHTYTAHTCMHRRIACTHVHSTHTHAQAHCMHMYTAHTHAQVHIHAHMYTAHICMHRQTCTYVNTHTYTVYPCTQCMRAQVHMCAHT